MAPTIIHAAGYSSEYPGNFVASLTQLRRACLDRGWDTVVVLPESAGERTWFGNLVDEGWRIETLPSNASRWMCARALTRLARREDCRLMHTHFVEYDLAAWTAARLLRAESKDMKVVWHAHSEIDARTPVEGLRRVTSRVKYGAMAKDVWMIPVGRSVARGFIKAGCPERRVRMVENGIDLQRATAVKRSRAEVLSVLGIDESARVALMFGWEPIRKGVDTALDAVAQLVPEMPDLVLVAVGADELQTYMDERFGEDRPGWLRVAEPAEDVASLYRAASVFLSPSRSEGLPYSVCEAMANRLPVLLSDIPSVAWAHRSRGVPFFPAGDAAALAGRMRETLNWSPEDRDRSTRANEHLVRTRYDVTAWADRVLAVYEEVLGTKLG